MRWTLWTSCILLVFVGLVKCDSQVVSVVMFHRHGDRSPYIFMPNDAENNARWPDGLGELTAKGMKELETLGTKFRQRYVEGEPRNKLFERYSPQEFFVRSTDYDRTLQSAESFLRGMFPPGSGPEGGLSDKGQVVPIRTMPAKWDTVLLGFKGFQCPRITQLMEDAMQSEAWKELESQREVLNEIAEAAGFSKEDFGPLASSNVFDPLHCELEHGFTWIEPFRSNHMLYEKAKSIYFGTLRPMNAFNDEMKRLNGGNMIARVISTFQRFSGIKPTVPETPTNDTPHLEDGTGKDSAKFVQFSAHDTTLTCLLGALEVFDDENPPYGASVVFELEKDNEMFFVRAFYNNDFRNPFMQDPLRLCDNQRCSLNNFVEKFSAVVPKDYKNECLRRNATDLVSRQENESCRDRSIWAKINAVFASIILVVSLFVLARTCASRVRFVEYNKVEQNSV